MASLTILGAEIVQRLNDPRFNSRTLLRPTNAPNLREKIVKLSFTVRVSTSSRYFYDFLAHLQRLGRPRYGFDC